MSRLFDALAEVVPASQIDPYDHFSDGRFRHGCTFLRVRPDKLPKDCLLEQVVEHAAIQNINAFIEGWSRDCRYKPKMNRVMGSV
jgi:hypothetical protein